MLKKNEIKILGKIMDNLTIEYTINSLSISLNQKYAQTYSIVKGLIKKELILYKKIGNSRVLMFNFKKENPEYLIAETQRKIFIKNKNIKEVSNILNSINKQFVCILFGSYASSKNKKRSDIDLLFIIPNEYDADIFKSVILNNLVLYNVDINIINEDNLYEMWNNKNELNLGNEILKNRIVLKGAEYFIQIMRSYYGR